MTASDLAVFKFITNSNLLGCRKGKSLGFSPARAPPAATPSDCRDLEWIAAFSFYHLISAHQDGFGKGDTQGSRGFIIDRQFKSRWTLDRQIGSFRAA
jgi:hypothetical protein